MNKRRLGRSELYVSEIALGSWLTFAGGIAREQSERCIHTAIELGINAKAGRPSWKDFQDMSREPLIKSRRSSLMGDKAQLILLALRHG